MVDVVDSLAQTARTSLPPARLGSFALPRHVNCPEFLGRFSALPMQEEVMPRLISALLLVLFLHKLPFLKLIQLQTLLFSEFSELTLTFMFHNLNFFRFS